MTQTAHLLVTTQCGPVNVPPDALRLDIGPCQFGELDGSSKNIPVKIVARTGKPLVHRYWGTVVHDLAGMKVHKPRLPIDYAHYDNEVLGYLDRFEVDTRRGARGDLVVAGELTPFTDNDRASEVANKAARGVPYEASILFTGPLKLEELEEGTEAEVNGYTLQGPALIIREWSLRGVAICPYGIDRDTATLFKGTGGETSITVERTLRMADKKTEDVTVDQRTELRRYIEAFGVQKGTEWHLAEKSFEECQQMHLDELRAASEQDAETITQLTGERDELKDQIAKLGTEKEALTEQVGKLTDDLKRFKQAVDRGEEAPVEFRADDDSSEGKRAAQLKQRLGENIGRIAAGLRFEN